MRSRGARDLVVASILAGTVHACGTDFQGENGAGGMSNAGTGGTAGSGTSGTAAAGAAGGGGSANSGSGGGAGKGTGGAISVPIGGTLGLGGTEQNPTLTSDVNVIITADNAYGFGYGTSTELLNYEGGVENPDADDIFACPIGVGPEEYVVPAENANAGGYLYIVSYADKLVTQGVIAKFFRDGAQPVFTGNGNWEGCATGVDFDVGAGGPSLEEINEQIELCNEGDSDTATSSGGWVGTAETPSGYVVFGEDNSTDRMNPMAGNEFKIACEIDPEAHWMWFEWEPDRSSGSPFLWPGGTENTTKDFLIFRLGAEYIPEEPR
jgi:hypothetical protein